MKKKKSKTVIKTFTIVFITLFVILAFIFSLKILNEKLITTEPQTKKTSKLYTLPYLTGYHKAPKKNGLTTFIPDKAYNGLNLFNSAHEPSAILMDMKGNILHKWQFAFKDAFPEVKEINTWYNQKHWRYFWRRVHLFDNGDLLAIYEGNGLIKIDKNCHLIWTAKGSFHHDLEVVGDKIYVLNRRLVRLSRINKKEPILEDLISILNQDGQILKNISILEMFENSRFARLMKGMPAAGDIFHTNTLEVFDGKLDSKSPIFKKGNVLLSMRMLDTIAIADLEAKKIIWARKPGIWKTQHQPTLLDNGHMLVFNNLYLKNRANKAEYRRLLTTNGYKLLENKIYTDNQSSVIEFNPLSMTVVWEYKGDEKHKFFSLASGSCQRLPNGNTLITDSDQGRAFEVTPQGQIVWEYVNIYRTGKKKDKIAAILEMVRFRPNSFISKIKAHFQP